MTKIEKIRAALKTAGAEGMDVPAIREKSGVKAPGSPLVAMVKRKEVIQTGNGHKHRYRLNPDYVPEAQRGKSGKRGNKSGKRGGKGRTIKDVARALLDSPKTKGNGIADLALDNYREASAQLRRAVVDQVDGYEHDTVLSAAIVNHERAEKMAQAAGAF